MAEVFLAKSRGAEGIEKLLVIKRILPSFARSEKFSTMFIGEAKVAMRLNHPNIVQVYAFEQERDDFLLAMEFVDGLDLGRLVAASRRHGLRLPPELCAYVVMEVARGLDYAHNRRDESGTPLDIVHRDVSPQNILLSYEGVVKIADFGIARARLLSEETGVIKGKFAYMSPEQARGQRVDRRSDVYSLGVLLAELLMNRPMYPDQPGMEVLELVREGRLPLPNDIDTAVPAGLFAVVKRATALPRRDRYQTARSMAGALSRWLHVQDDMADATQLEQFMLEVAPPPPSGSERPDGKEASGLAETQASLARLMHEFKERRNVVVLHGRFRNDNEISEVIGWSRVERPISEQTAQILGDLAYKYDAVLEWPEALGKGAFRFVLGLGRASVDDPLHAAQLAMDIVEALSGLSADRRVRISASVGMSRGLVTSGRTPKRRVGVEPVGPVFEVAQALAEHAAPDEILAAAEVHRLVRRAYAFDEEHVRSVPFGSSALRGYRLRGARTREERAAEAMAFAGEVGLFGRSMEVQALRDRYEEAVQTRRSAYIAVVGELGIGKSALIAGALGQFKPDPRLLRVDCVFGTAAVPYAAVAELVREACGIAEGAGRDEVLSRLDTTLASVFSETARRPIRDALAPLVDPHSGPRRDPSEHAAPVMRAVRQLLRGLATLNPLVVWVDALQFADQPSLQLLKQLLAKTYELPLLVVLAARPDERTEREILRRIPVIEVDELEERERSALISARLGDARVPPDIEQAIIHRAGGNPFFLIELIDTLLERDAIEVIEEGGEREVRRRPGATFVLPTTLEGVVAARITELPDGERRTLRWLAVAGPGTRPLELASITGQSLEAELSALETRGLVQRRAGGALYFPSAVFRHVAYESIDVADRQRMHRLVAAYLDEAEQKVAPAQLALHREKAGDRAGAAEAYWEAGEAAESMYSHQDALRLYGRALELIDKDAALNFALHEAREEILRVQGARKRQREELEAMRVWAERSRDPHQIAVAFCRLSRFDLDASRPAGVDAMLRRALDAAIEADDKSAEIEALRLLGQLRRDQGDVRGAAEALDRALVRAGPETELLAIRGQALVDKGVLLHRVGRLLEALELLSEAFIIFRRLGLKSLEADALHSLGVTLSRRGSFEDAMTMIHASVLIDREVGDRIHLGRKLSDLGQVYGEIGDFDRADLFLHRALTAFDAVDDQVGRAAALCALAELYAQRPDRMDQAEALSEEAKRIAERVCSPYESARVLLAAASICAAKGDASCQELNARKAYMQARMSSSRGFSLMARASRALALARLADSGAARELAMDMLSTLESGPGADLANVARADRLLATLADVLDQTGDNDAALKAWNLTRNVVEFRLRQLRDQRLREHYQQSQIVMRVRAQTGPSTLSTTNPQP